MNMADEGVADGQGVRSQEAVQATGGDRGPEATSEVTVEDAGGEKEAGGDEEMEGGRDEKEEEGEGKGEGTVNSTHSPFVLTLLHQNNLAVTYTPLFSHASASKQHPSIPNTVFSHICIKITSEYPSLSALVFFFKSLASCTRAARTHVFYLTLPISTQKSGTPLIVI